MLQVSGCFIQCTGCNSSPDSKKQARQGEKKKSLSTTAFVTDCRLVAGTQHRYLSTQKLSAAYLSKLEHCSDVDAGSRDASDQDRCHVRCVLFIQLWPVTRPCPGLSLKLCTCLSKKKAAKKTRPRNTPWVPKQIVKVLPWLTAPRGALASPTLT